MGKKIDVEAVVTAVKQSPKYSSTSEETIRELAIEAARRYKKPKAAVKAVRAQLHSIMAPYLGDPDYVLAAARLDEAFAAGDAGQIEAICRDVLYAHLSTRERLPILAEFYERIFGVTGRPRALMDVACGLNPLALRWMGLDSPPDFYAYDIHEPRIAFINHYFQLEGLPPLAKVQDVALEPPQARVDVALFLKEMPRFARHYHGRGRPLLEAIRADFLVVSYPSVSTRGGRNLTGRYRDFMRQLTEGRDWPVTELLFEGELVFVLDKRRESRDER